MYRFSNNKSRKWMESKDSDSRKHERKITARKYPLCVAEGNFLLIFLKIEFK